MQRLIMGRVGLNCSYPHATDCSSGSEEENTVPDNTIYRIDETPVQPESPKSLPRPIQNSKTPHPGVYLTPSGRYTSETRNPITRTRHYLGSFDSPNAAFEAYCGKKLEFNEKAAAEEIKLKGPQEACSTKKLELNEKVVPEKKKKKSPYKGVYFDGSRWRSDIHFMGKRYYVGKFRSAEVAYQAYCSKKQELEKNESRTRKGVKSGSFDPIWDPRTQVRVGISRSGEGFWGDKSGSGPTAEKVSGSDFINTLKIYASSSSFSGQDPISHEKPMFGEKAASKEEEKTSDFGSGLIPREMDSLIVDEDGFLVGEFSKIDDLTICEIDGC